MEAQLAFNNPPEPQMADEGEKQAVQRNIVVSPTFTTITATLSFILCQC